MGGLTGHHGVLVVDKPRGPTSHDVVARARRVYQTRAVGHAGTLDPMATGVLILLVGEATKLTPFLTLDRKSYEATIHFGRSTDTLDAEGEVVAERPFDPSAVGGDALASAIAAELARRTQLPPRYSAIKIGGVAAHRRARRGEALDLAERPVRVEALDVVFASDVGLVVRLSVSKGYYVRAFARDLCAHLGVEGHLAALRRLASGSFCIDEATAWPLEEPTPLIGVADAALRSLPEARLSETGARKALLGQRLTRDDFVGEPGGSPAAWVSKTGQLVAVGRRGPEDDFTVIRGFRPMAGAEP